MRIDSTIQRALDELPVAYTIRKSKDHYFAVVEGFAPIIIGGNHDRHKARLVKSTVTAIRKVHKTLESK
jgi:hypothetical protein